LNLLLSARASTGVAVGLAFCWLLFPTHLFAQTSPVLVVVANSADAECVKRIGCDIVQVESLLPAEVPESVEDYHACDERIRGLLTFRLLLVRADCSSPREKLWLERITKSNPRAAVTHLQTSAAPRAAASPCGDCPRGPVGNLAGRPRAAGRRSPSRARSTAFHTSTIASTCRAGITSAERNITVKKFFNLDALGVCASSLCMVHCLAFPLLLAALPFLTIRTEAQESEAAAHADVADCCAEHACCANQAGDSAACCSTPTDFWIHVGLGATVAPLGLIAWGAGVRRHRGWGVLLLGGCGVLLMVAALFVGQHILDGRGEQIMTVAGSICMVTAHLWNRRKCKCCQTSSPASNPQADVQPVAI